MRAGETVGRLWMRPSAGWRRPGRWRPVGLPSPTGWVKGRWWRGKVNGVLLDAGWGARLGYPGLVLDPDATAVDVHVFESADLPAHWARLDAFEGRGYQRAVTTVQAPDGDVEASIYVLREQSHRRASD